MPRAKRFYIPGYIWHITHRCHKKEFLLKFARDRCRWLEWLFEAKKRYGLQILNYMVTSNHIHLLVSDSSGNSAIPKSMQLIAGRTGQEYNQRKNRNGAYWEDRYHATAVQTDHHLLKCMLYIDLNMVRAGAVAHPSEWEFCGFNEIINLKQRYRLIDHQRLMDLLYIETIEDLKHKYRQWIDETLENEENIHEPKGSRSIAVGEKGFVEKIRKELGNKGRYRETTGQGANFQLKEDLTPYNTDFAHENVGLSLENTHYWGDII